SRNCNEEAGSLVGAASLAVRQFTVPVTRCSCGVAATNGGPHNGPLAGTPGEALPSVSAKNACVFPPSARIGAQTGHFRRKSFKSQGYGEPTRGAPTAIHPTAGSGAA